MALTQDMTRLRGEIAALRDARRELLEEAIRGARNLKKAVSVMKVGFSGTRAQMAKTMQAECATFLSDVKESVDDLKQAVAASRKEFAADIVGGRSAWLGRGCGTAAAQEKFAKTKGRPRSKSARPK